MVEKELEQAAQHLGAVLRSTKEMAAYLEAKRLLDADHEALLLIEKQASLQQTVREKQDKGLISIADVEELNDLQDDVSSKISAYLGAELKAKALLTVVNREISRVSGFAFASLARPSGCC